jgi:competence ComEA-like helix-hairpin-helix protein
MGGAISTASGLVFVGFTDDSRFRALDAKTGKELWAVKLNASVMATRFLTFAGVLLSTIAVFCTALAAGQKAPEGSGQELTLKLCTAGCHGPEKFLSEHRSRSQWLETIETMKQDGAKGTDDEFKIALGYLVAHLGIPVKINKATARQIDDAMDLQPGQADAIVKYRDEHGPFPDLAALLKVPGLDARRLEEQKTNIVF